MILNFVFLLASLTLCASISRVDQCLDRFVDSSLLQFRAGTNPDRTVHSLNNEIRIIPHIEFKCNTIITSVILGIDVRPVEEGMRSKNRNRFPSVQVWRPTGDESEYKLLAGSERFVVYTPANVSRTGVHEYPLIPSVSVAPGDMIAISQPAGGESVVRCYSIELNNFNSYELDSGTTMKDLPPDEDKIVNNELVLIYPVTEPSTCVSTPITPHFIREQSLLITEREDIGKRRQIIYPEMDFRCNGTIIKWIYAGTMESGNEKPELQIWRRIRDDMYVKQNFSQVIFNKTNSTNVHEFYPTNPIEFNEGDVFGLYQPDDANREFVLFAQKGNGPNNYRVDPNIDQSSTDLVLSELRLEGGNDFPLVSLEISIDGIDATSSLILTETSSPLIPAATALVVMTSTTLSVATDQILSATTNTVAVVTELIDISTKSIRIGTLTSTNTIASPSNDINQSNRAPFGTESAGIKTLTSINPMASPSNNIIQSLKNDDSDLKLIGAIVAVFLLMLTVIVCTVIIVIILLWKKKKESNPFLPMDSKEQSLSNPIYNYQANTDLTSSERTIVPGDYEQQFETLYHQPMSDPEASVLYDEIKERNIHTDNQYNHLKWNIVVPTLDQRRRMSEQYSSIGEAVNSIYSGTGMETTAVDCQYQFLNSSQSSFFEEDSFYWTPAMDYGGLYEQLASKKFREILISQISVSSTLGSGNFGKVLNGLWESPDGPLSVAVKTLKERATEEEKIKFLQEAAIMGQFRHPNIVKIFGVVTLQEPLMIVIELMRNGDLKQYLGTLKPVPGEMVAPLVPELLLDFCRQVSSALEYLSKKCYVHRDIAARNVLVTEEKICKISDFGLSRDLQDETYYVSKGGQLPIKWTAPEALLYKKFSTSSDVWSFGVLMYEIWSLGEKPFQNRTNQQTYRVICDGYRLPPPPGCPRAMYEIMMQCWHPKTGGRPSFSKLVTDLSQTDDQLLNIREELHQQTFVLGASLEFGQDVYLDLQNVYKSYKID